MSQAPNQATGYDAMTRMAQAQLRMPYFVCDKKCLLLVSARDRLDSEARATNIIEIYPAV